MEGVTIRPARREDTERIAEIMHGEPGDEAIALMGTARKARQLGTALVRMKGSPQGWERTVVAELAGRVVGIMQAGAKGAETDLSPGIVWAAIRVLGPIGVFMMLPRLRARGRVQPSLPDGGYHISELHVDPACRGQGIGGELLQFAEEQAVAGEFPSMTLTTTTDNPARRLYERHGFTVTDTKTDAEYERLTGIAGRFGMVKTLTPGS